MILSGKAERDFIKYIYDEYNLQPYNIFNDTFQYALIIEWFDSVGIYIELFKEDYCFAFNLHRGNCKIKDYIIGISGYNSRKETIQQAIIKANEVYNNI